MADKKIVCCGGGVIGSSWAVYFSFKGYPVTVYDINDQAIEKSKTSVSGIIGSLKNLGVLSDKQADEVAVGIAFTADPAAAFTGAYLIQENVPEKLELKHAVLDVIELYAPDTAIFASSTSGMPISSIAAKCKHPERCIGAHPFNPPHLMPLVEIGKGEKTQQRYVDEAVAFYRSIGKEPVVMLKEKVGFIANRLSHVVLREVMSLVTEGVCSVEDIDKSLTYGLGLRWASVGQVMVGELGSANGIGESIVKFKGLNESIFQDIENLQYVPEDWPEVAQKGVDEEKVHMPDYVGHTTPEIAAFRDSVLIELLRLHHKL